MLGSGKVLASKEEKWTQEGTGKEMKSQWEDWMVDESMQLDHNALENVLSCSILLGASC